MSFDGIALSAICSEIKQKILGWRVHKIFQPNLTDVILIFNKPGNTQQNLLLSAHPHFTRTHFISQKPENPLTAPNFCLVLRKHLEGKIITKVKQVGLDRQILLYFSKKNSLLPSCNLIGELMGRHSNLILINNDSQTIIDALKRYDYSLSRYREILPGRSYISPPIPEKKLPFHFQKAEDFLAFLLSFPPETALTKAIIQGIQGFGAVSAAEIVEHAGLSLHNISNCSSQDFFNLWEAFSTTVYRIAKGSFEPSLSCKNGHSQTLSVIGLNNAFSVKKCSSVSVCLEKYYLQKIEDKLIAQLSQKIKTYIDKKIERICTKRHLHNLAIQESPPASRYYEYGQLLLASINQIKKGQTKIALTNYFDPDYHKVHILLDPKLTPAENAQAYFRLARKTKNRQEIAQKQLAELSQEKKYLEGVLTSLNQVEQYADLQEIKEELNLSFPRIHKSKTKIKAARLKPQPLIFYSSEGFELVVGKNNRQNDFITTQLARPDDIWLHARQTPGAHIVIRSRGKQVPSKTMKEAAILAAVYSKAKNSSKVAVDYTFRKNVRKPKGSKPGQVFYSNHKTLTVKPDFALEKHLKKKLQPASRLD